MNEENQQARRGLGRPRPDPERRMVIAGRIEVADGSELLVTVHCVDRFWERAAGGCTNFRAALERLQLLAGQSGQAALAPDWAGTLDADRYVAISDDVGLVVHGDRAVTCVVPGGFGDGVRERRNRKRRRRPNDGRSGRTPKPPASPDICELG